MVLVSNAFGVVHQLGTVSIGWVGIDRCKVSASRAYFQQPKPTKRMPENKRKIIPLLSLLAELEQGGFSRLRAEQLDDEPVDLVVLVDGRRGPAGGRRSSGRRG